jgi:hypothetical protein
MVIVALFGGLGNQMFQYACGKAIAKKLGVELKLDISLILDRSKSKDFTFREYELGAFNIKEQIASIKEVRQYVPNLYIASDYKKKLFKIKRILNRRALYFEKSKFEFDKRIESVNDHSYIYGYFQTEKYFQSIGDEILNSFSIREVLDDANNYIIKQLKSENAISIHIRRGDYQNSDFELLDITTYYLKAIEIITKEVENPIFYFFSDDIIWTEEKFRNFEINKKFILHNTGEKSFIDMILMSHCQHNICANSTFSWWGAWLNRNPQKIIIVPKKWFNNGEFSRTTYDLIPNYWIQI